MTTPTPSTLPTPPTDPYLSTAILKACHAAVTHHSNVPIPFYTIAEHKAGQVQAFIRALASAGFEVTPIPQEPTDA